jgi:hypothetical protein
LKATAKSAVLDWITGNDNTNVKANTPSTGATNKSDEEEGTVEKKLVKPLKDNDYTIPMPALVPE